MNFDTNSLRGRCEISSYRDLDNPNDSHLVILPKEHVLAACDEIDRLREELVETLGRLRSVHKHVGLLIQERDHAQDQLRASKSQGAV